MGWLRSGLFRKFITVMGALSLIPVTLLGYQLLSITRKGIQAVQTKRAQKLAELVDEHFRVTKERFLFALSTVERIPDQAEKERLLRTLFLPNTDILELALFDPAGRELLRVSNPALPLETALVRGEHEIGFQGYLKLRRRTIAVTRKTGAPLLYLYYPLKGNTMGRAVASLKRLSERFATEQVGGSGFAVLVDVVGEPLLFARERFQDPGLRDFPVWPIVLSAVKASSVGFSEFNDPRGKVYVGAYAPVFSIGSAVIFLQSRDAAFQVAANLRRSALWGVLALACFCLLGAGFLARRLTEPILALTQAAEAVSRGDFQSTVEISTHDELQELARTFNRMTASLRSYSLLHVDRLISEQRKTEGILYSINEGILMTDREGRVQLVNRRALELLGVREDSIEGKVLREVLPESKLREAILLAAENPSPEVIKEVDLSTEEKHCYLHVMANLVSTPRGTPLGLVIAVRDVTFEKQLDKMKEEFLQYITHDLRNPLGSAIGFLDVLLKGTVGVLNSEQQNVVSSVKRSSTRLMNMVNNILDIAKMDSGRIRVEPKTISLSGIAARSLSILESLAQQKGLLMRLEAAEEFSLEADPDLVERVFVNLISNAIKYTQPGGTVRVLVQDEGPELRACVEDTGEGIPAQYLERIFEKFEQVSGQKRGGTGLGLTIARYFVEAHLGRIWVESQPGKGSRFTFSLPKHLCLDEDGRAVVREAQRP